MQKETRTVTTTCDLCANETPKVWTSVSEEEPVGVMSMTYDIWYGGTFEVKDICMDCQRKLAQFMRQNKMIGNGQRRPIGAQRR